METPITPLQPSIKILQFVKSINNDDDNVEEIELINVMKEDGEAKKRDLDFLYKIKQHAM